MPRKKTKNQKSKLRDDLHFFHASNFVYKRVHLNKFYLGCLHFRIVFKVIFKSYNTLIIYFLYSHNVHNSRVLH